MSRPITAPGADTDPFAELMPMELRVKMLSADWRPEELLDTIEQPTNAVLVEELDWQLRLPLWSDTDAPFNLSPLQVERNPRRYRFEWDQVMQADLKESLLLLDAGTETQGPLILAGLHRLLKARHLGLAYLPARTILLDQLSD